MHLIRTSMHRGGQSARRGDLSEYGIVLAVALGSFMTIFDGAAVQMTLPVVRKELGGSIQEVEWVMLAFFVVSTSTLLPFGRAGDVFGRERLYRAGILVFIVGSTLCAVAPSLVWLIGARAVQGIGAAMTTANASPILVNAFPHSSGRVLGLGNIALGAGMIAGPPLGAVFTQLWSWRLIFLVALPVGCSIFWVTRRGMPRSVRLHADLDLPSGLLAVVGLGALLVAGTIGRKSGYASRSVLALLGLAAIAIVWFIVRESRTKQPVLALSLMLDRTFLSGLLAALFGYAALFMAFAALPFLLVTAQHRSLGQAGVLVAVLPVALALTAPFAGSLTDRIGSRGICAASLVLTAISFFLIAVAGDHLSTARILFSLVLAGIGLGGFEAPNGVAVLRSIPRDRMGAGAAFLGAVRNLGMTFGVAAGAALLEHASGPGTEAARTAEGVRWALAGGSCSALLGALSCLLRPKGARRSPGSSATLAHPALLNR